MDGLSSVSKGCFVVHGLKKSKHRVTNLDASSYLKTDEKVAEVRWQMAKEFWSTIELKMKKLHASLTSKIFEDILDFMRGSSKLYNSCDISGKRTEIPTAALITGINMPDHSELFHQLSENVKAVISPHVAVLSAKQCTNMKTLMRCIGQQLILGETGEKLNSSVDDAENELSGGCTKNIIWRKSVPLTTALLEQWYLQMDLETKAEQSLKKKKPSMSSRKPIVIMLEDVEAFSSSLLHDFILMLSSLMARVPVILVFGIATSWGSVVDRQLTHSATVHLGLEKFHSPSSSHHLALIIDEILLTSEHPFKISGRCLELLLDVFLCHDFSVTNFLLNLKFCVFEHYYEESASIFCTCSLDAIRENIRTLSNKDLNLLRKLPSVQRFLDALTSSQQKLQQSDDHLYKKTLLGMLESIHQYHLCFFPVLRCLYTLCKSLPRHPLGRQVRELYCMCARRNVTETAEYKQAYLFLRVSSKDQLLERLPGCVKDLQNVLNSQTSGNNINSTENMELTAFVTRKIPDLEEIIESLRDLNDNTDVVEEDEDNKENNCSEVPIEQVKYAYQLQEKLKTRSKQKKIRKMTKFEKLRLNALDLLDEIFRKVLFPPSSFPFHEVFYFDSPIILKRHALPSPRVSIQKALSDPHYYLREQCLQARSAGVIPPSAPDICIAYKLHNECGRMINLCDWLEAFYTIISSGDHNNGESGKDEINEITQARFIQAASELQFLGFIKPTKRKTDHVQRLTWSHA